MLDLALTPPERSSIAPATTTIDRLPTRALGFVAPALYADIRRILSGVSLDVELTSNTNDFTTRVISYAPHLLVVDIDAPGMHPELVNTARALRRGVHVLGLAYYWSEREGFARALADALVHKPPRAAEWLAQLRRLGLVAPAAA